MNFSGKSRVLCRGVFYTETSVILLLLQVILLHVTRLRFETRLRHHPTTSARMSNVRCCEYRLF
jgi:hypothetical protein